MIDDEKKQRHAERMQRKKAVVDAGIERAQEERGIVVLITGNGKGKTTSAFGTLYRALGYGHQVGVVQFIKGTQASGEVTYLRQNAAQVAYHAMATGFTWDTQNWDADKAAALGRYTDALLDHESREGAVILWALKRLDGHWDDARLRRAAALSADRLGAEYVRLARCVDCTIADAVDGLWPQVREATTDRLQEIADVHGELVRLADGD